MFFTCVAKLPRLLDANPVFRRLRLKIPYSLRLLISGLCCLIYVCHFTGCIYISISAHEMNADLQHISQGSSGDLTQLTSRLTERDWLPTAEVVRLHLDDTGRPIFDWHANLTYLYGVLWVLCALTGTNAAMPTTLVEGFFSFSVVLGGLLVTAYVIGTFTTALSEMSAGSHMESRKRDYIEQFLLRKKIPRALRLQVAQFYEFAGFEDSEEVLSELPVSLRLQLDLVFNRDLFLKVPSAS